MVVMTRQVDITEPKNLSIDDRIYLQDRGKLPKGAKRVTNEEREDYVQSQADAGNDVSDEDLEKLPYSEWPLDSLKEEANARGLKDTGGAKKIAERLEADDDVKD